MASKLATFIVVLLIAVVVASIIPPAHGARTLEHLNLPAAVASSPTTEITFDVVTSEDEAEGPTALGPDTVHYYDDDKTPITGPL
ncbi:hypothetical protein BDA96_10G265100 [Sorghum bicolor]|jgi:hypothetical protein|uniref:Uncharacterized protein n=2 Tax=Sorghum bicolor TaxID=4558 RepID=A0A921Q7F6_SORBI|nr:hypothetical protein BDA96_10G265100 [Sorghum bicolor]KXG20462.1 hypothetical protein SORBI_3010G203700 [Sorghum bicolor]